MSAKTFSKDRNANHERSEIVKINIILSFIYKGINIVIQLALIPLTIHYLDKYQYGVWLTLSEIIGWITFFDIGLGNGLRNRLTEAMAKEDYHLARTYISTSYAILSIAFFGLALLFCFINHFIEWSFYLNTPASMNVELSNLALITFIFFCLRFIFGLLTSILFAVQKAAVNNLITTISNILSILFIYFLKYFIPNSLFWVGVIFSVVPVITFMVFNAILFFNKLNYIKPSFKHINFHYTLDLMGLGYRFFIIQIAGIIIFSSTNIIIAQLFGPGDVTAYNVAFRYFTTLTMVYGIVLTPLWSAFTDAYVKNDMAWVKRIVRKLNLISVVFSVIVIVMIIYANCIYKIWVGESVIVPKSLSVGIGIYVIFSLFASPYNSFINGVGKITLQYYTAIFSIIFTIPLAIIFAKYLEWGAAGVIAAILCTTIPCTFLWKIQYERIISNRADGVWDR